MENTVKTANKYNPQDYIKQADDIYLSLIKAGGYEHIVSKMADLGSYSLRNQMLIQMQKPEATNLNTMKSWNYFGRSIIKGSESIKILAPVFDKKITTNANGEITEKTSDYATGYAIELKGFKDGLPSGDLFELDITEFAKTVKKKAIPAHHVLLIYNDGVSTIPYVSTWGTKIKEMDRLVRAIVLPVDLKQWDKAVNVVQEERRQNAYYSDWDISKLQNNFTKTKNTEMEM